VKLWIVPTFTDALLYWSYFLFVVAIVVTIFLQFGDMQNSPKKIRLLHSVRWCCFDFFTGIFCVMDAWK
jgi:hypothetical protein